MKKYCYRIDKNTRLGEEFRSWWNRFVKAEQAQQSFCRKVGADGWQDDEGRVLAGGVVAVSFPKGKKVDERQWRPSHKDADGVQMYVPAIEHRTGALLLPRRGFQPSSTATRLYDRRPCPWDLVQTQQTDEEWARQAGITLTGDQKTDRQLLVSSLSGKPCCPYIDLYHKDYDPLDDGKATTPAAPADETAEGKADGSACGCGTATNPAPKRRNGRRVIPFWVREAIRIEMARLKLPTVTPQSLYTLLDAPAVLPEGQQQAVITEFAPQFFEYNGFYWIAIPRAARHKGCIEVEEPTFAARLRDMQALQRELARQAKEDRSWN